MSEKIVAVIPAFNEEKTVGKIISDVKKFVDDVIVIDDASSDKTGEEAIKHSAIVVRHTHNQGYDKTLDDGFQEAVRRDATIILTFDADGQHVAEDIPLVINPIKQGDADVVVGLRPWKIRVSEKLFSWFAKRKIGINDPLCGMKAYSSKAYNTVGYFDRLNSIGTELMFNCVQQGFRIVEVPIHLNERKGKPRFGSRIKGNWRIFIALFKIYRKFRTVHRP